MGPICNPWWLVRPGPTTEPSYLNGQGGRPTTNTPPVFRETSVVGPAGTNHRTPPKEPTTTLDPALKHNLLVVVQAPESSGSSGAPQRSRRPGTSGTLKRLVRVPGVLGHLSAQGAPELPELSGAWLEFLEFWAISALKVPRNSRNSQAPG
jgi:hypothetical protein